MMTRICEAIQAVKPETDFEPMINIAHNYAAWENHFDQDVIVHRKGATRAMSEDWYHPRIYGY